MAETRKGACPRCPRTDVSLIASGDLRAHAANGKKITPDNPACPGSGNPPATGQAEQPGVQGYVCRIPVAEGCGVQVTLTSNGRARSHLMADMSTPCPGGSDWPLRVDPQGNRHDTAPGSEPSPAVGPEGLLMGDDGPADFDPAPDEPDEDEPEPVRQLRLAGVLDEDDGAMDAYGRGRNGLPHPDAPGSCTCERDPGQFEGPAEDCPQHGNPAVLFDVTHTYDDGAGGTWVHPGEVADCRTPECCTHPRGFDWGDDGHGHSGEWCFLCGAAAPEPEPGPDDWKTPADILARMPEGVRRMAECDPQCWDCGHEITPLADRFEPDGSVKEITWACRDNCEHSYASGLGTHLGSTCRPQLLEEAHLYDLERGAYFVRHTTRPPLNRLVYRVESITPGVEIAQVTVVSPGAHTGRTGELTTLSEEITCTNHEGTPRPRRDRATGATSPNSPGPNQPSTPSRPAPTTRPDQAPGPGSRHRSPGTARPAVAPTRRGISSEPTATADGKPSTAAVGRTEPVADAFATAKQAVSESDRYDRFGRYKLTHPDTGKPVKWTRASTFSKSIQDTFALNQWAIRMVLKGASMRPDIPAAASTLDVKKDKNRLNELGEDAKKAAGAKVAANKGTAVHAYTEDRDKILVGEPVDVRPVPEEYAPTVDAYAAILEAFGLEPVPGLIEFTTAVKQFQIAGTSDRVYRVTRDISFKLGNRTITLYAGEYVIGDVKTGADLSYGWQEIVIQLALYAQGLNTSGVWSWEHGVWGKPTVPGSPDVLLKVRTDVGLIPHLPVDRSTTGAPLATLYAIDLDAGWAACVLCEQVRDWRKTGNLATALEVADVAEPEPSSFDGADTPYDGHEPLNTAREKPVSRPQVASRPATLEDKARAVTTRAQASSVFQEAKAARVPVPELNRLVGLMTAKLESFVEQGA